MPDETRPGDIRRLLRLLEASPLVGEVLSRGSEIGLPDWHLAAGCIAQTVWNDAHGLPPAYGIGDIDIVYFDEDDLGEAAEAVAQQRLSSLFREFGVPIDVKNQARVHQWYHEAFGDRIEPFRSIAHAVASYPTTATAVAVSPAGIVAPFGLADLWELVVRPNRRMARREVYERKVARWQRLWPRLTYLPWEDGTEGD